MTSLKIAWMYLAPSSAHPAKDHFVGAPFARAKRHLLAACGAIGLGLAIAGSLSQRWGGALLLVGGAAAVLAVHRLGRTGPDRGDRPA